jgi:hypothetical protein
MAIRVLIALVIVSFLTGSASALPLKPMDSTADIVLVRGGHGHGGGHGHAHGSRGRHLGWYIGRHRGWSHSHHRMY